ncbi:uncharacterized protein [Pithys albifrons albifrons]|uniref:uncharacterized protein n=1 Tax=Pithys albifrons albifrons TaxID=3385563 RepID=UPI003A5CB851
MFKGSKFNADSQKSHDPEHVKAPIPGATKPFRALKSPPGHPKPPPAPPLPAPHRRHPLPGTTRDTSRSPFPGPQSPSEPSNPPRPLHYLPGITATPFPCTTWDALRTPFPKPRSPSEPPYPRQDPPNPHQPLHYLPGIAATPSPRTTRDTLQTPFPGSRSPSEPPNPRQDPPDPRRDPPQAPVETPFHKSPPGLPNSVGTPQSPCRDTPHKSPPGSPKLRRPLHYLPGTVGTRGTPSPRALQTPFPEPRSPSETPNPPKLRRDPPKSPPDPPLPALLSARHAPPRLAFKSHPPTLIGQAKPAPPTASYWLRSLSLTGSAEIRERAAYWSARWPC